MTGLQSPDQPKPGELLGALRKRYKPVRPIVKEAVKEELTENPASDRKTVQRSAFRTAEKINPLVYKDNLTGLNNQRWFEEEVKRKIAAANRSKKPLWILTLDIDDFKKFNSQYGHPGGDTVLKAIKLPSREDEPIARTGGDEFSELLDEEISEEQIIGIVNRYGREMSRISKSLELKPIKEVSEDELTKEITLTFGLTKYQEGESADDFQRRANLAMHEAKNRGKDRIIVADKTADETPSYRELELT